MRSDRAIFVSWIGFHGRSAGLARELDIECHFVDGGSGNVARRYLRQWRETARIVRRHRPSAVVVMQPPIVALWSVMFATSSSVRLIGDLHTGVFTDPKWKWATGFTLNLLRRRGSAIVTGSQLAEVCRVKGVDALVLHDIVHRTSAPEGEAESAVVRELLDGGPFVLVPLAYAFDEPIPQILKAASIYPSVNWVLTGKAPEHIRAAAPSTVIFPGYVSDSDYSRLLHAAAAVAALTAEENTMQRAGYEALSAGRPLVTAPTKVLRDYFSTAAFYATLTTRGIADAVRTTVAEGAERSAAMKKLCEIKTQEQETAVEKLKSEFRLGSGRSVGSKYVN